jgi:hypothetical protein
MAVLQSLLVQPLPAIGVADGPTIPNTGACMCEVSTTSSSTLLIVVYRPGSVAPSIAFVDDISSILERLIVLGGPVYLVGDLDVVDHVDDPMADQLRLLFDAVAAANISFRWRVGRRRRQLLGRRLAGRRRPFGPPIAARTRHCFLQTAEASRHGCPPDCYFVFAALSPAMVGEH